MLEQIQTQLPLYFPILFFVVGLCFGSFANVVIYRLPKKKNVATPRSACPSCGHEITWYENIPVLSWIFLRGKCSSCKTSISFRYPLVELLMGLLFVALYLKVGWSWTLLEYLIFGFSLVVVSFIDFDHMILPDTFTLSGIVIGLMGALLNPEREFLTAFYGVLLGGGSLYFMALLYYIFRKKDGMGGGDIKLLAWIGALLGAWPILFVIMFSSVVGSIVGVAVALKSKEGLQSGIPFGPYLALAAIAFIFFGEELLQWYLSLVIQST